MADHVLYMGVRGVTDLMVAPGLVNLDFADIRTVMAEMGKAMMGTGEADGENRAIRAAEAAISNPLLEDTSMAGARGLLINITGGEDMTLFEVDQAANRIREEVDEDANIIFGSAIDEKLHGQDARLGGGDRHRYAGAGWRRSGRIWSRSACRTWMAGGLRPRPDGWRDRRTWPLRPGSRRRRWRQGGRRQPRRLPRGVRPFTRSALAPALQPGALAEESAGEPLAAHGNAALAGARPMPNRGQVAAMAAEGPVHASRPAHRGLFAPQRGRCSSSRRRTSATRSRRCHNRCRTRRVPACSGS